MNTLLKNEMRNLNGGTKQSILVKPDPIAPTIATSLIDNDYRINDHRIYFADGVHVSVVGSTSSVSGLNDSHGGISHSGSGGQ